MISCFKDGRSCAVGRPILEDLMSVDVENIDLDLLETITDQPENEDNYEIYLQEEIEDEDTDDPLAI